jgi:hypothetical protein
MFTRCRPAVCLCGSTTELIMVFKASGSLRLDQLAPGP